MADEADGHPVIRVPRPALVVLAGPSGSGKSTFAARHFAPTEIVSSDAMRALVSDYEGNQHASSEAFDLLESLIDKRLGLRRLTVVDSTALRPTARRDLLRIARRHGLPAILIVLCAGRDLCLARDAQRRRQVGAAVIDRQLAQMRAGLDRLDAEGFDRVVVLTAEEADQAGVVVERARSSPATREQGRFDVIGDIHGCADELEELLRRLGYAPDRRGVWRHPAGRRFVVLGDLTDRGPKSVEVLGLVIAAVDAGAALYTPGNHCNKLMRYLKGNKVRIGHGLQETIRQIDALPPDEHAALTQATLRLIGDAPPYLVLDHGRLVVAHAGLREWMIGLDTRQVRDFVLYGDVTGQVDARGLPVRGNWAAEYHGTAAIVYGHTVVPEAVWLNNTINIDQGCVFGGCLTAVRWPERDIRQVAAHAVYSPRDTPDLEPAGDKP